MLNNHIIQFFINDWLYALFAVVALFLITAGLHLLSVGAFEFKDSIMKKKQLKQTIIEEFSNDLHKLKDHLDKLLVQKRVVGTFSFDSISSALEHINDSEKKIAQLRHLEDGSLNEQIAGYLSFQRKLLTELKNLEHKNYQQQKEYQEMIIFYNREYAEYSQKVSDEESLKAIHQRIKTELRDNRNKVLSEMNTSTTLIEKYYVALENSQQLHQITINMMSQYKEKHIKTKRFYLKQFSYV